MDKEEEHFHKIAEKLSKEHKLVESGKMMSSPGISYSKKFFAFYFKKEITLKLGKDFVPADYGVKNWGHLNPFKKKAPMKNWFQFPYSEKKNWTKLTKQAMSFLADEMKSEI